MGVLLQGECSRRNPGRFGKAHFPLYGEDATRVFSATAFVALGNEERGARARDFTPSHITWYVSDLNYHFSLNGERILALDPDVDLYRLMR